ncbi:MAG TPA: hypothetical protein VKQ72_22545 [Aggregatilineales bacterium]|nr:hypothetical protein [Aggregatilineales bacterium]
MKLGQIALYLITALVIGYAAYSYLEQDAQATGNYSVSIILVGWPTIFLIIGAILLLLGGGVSLVDRQTGARVALLVAIVSFGHFLFVIPVGFCLMSILIFILPKAIVTIVFPLLLLIATTIYSSRVGRISLRRGPRLISQTK